MQIGAIPSNKNVLILDSGVGGITVARAIAAHRIGVNLHYLADDAGFPYGSWQKDALTDRIIHLVKNARTKTKIDACVIACNTATVLALNELRKQFSFPVLGTEPALKPAVLFSKTKQLSVLVTQATADSTYLRAFIRKIASGAEVRVIAAPNLAQIAEDHIKGKSIDREALRREILPAFIGTQARRTDSVVLGCTHYPLLLEELKLSAPWDVNWLDPANGVANQLMRVLYPSSFKWGPNPLPRSLKFDFTSGNLSPDLQGKMRELCEPAVLSSPETHLKQGAVAYHLRPATSL